MLIIRNYQFNTNNPWYITIDSIDNISKKYIYPTYRTYYSSKDKNVDLTDIKPEYCSDIYFETVPIGTSA